MALSSSMRRELPSVGILLALAILAGLPLFSLQNPSGHDAIFAMPRYVEFYRNLSEGQLVPRWAPDLSLGYGEPFFEFTPPLFFYLVAGLHALGIGFAAAGNLAAWALLALAGGAMYGLAREFFGPRGGLIAAAAYVFAPYLLVNLYVRYAMGDFAAFALAPLAMWGVARFARAGGALGAIAGALGTALLVLSSNHVALMTFPVLLAVPLAVGLVRRSAVAVVRGGLAAALGLALSAFFWAPALVERRYVELGFAVKGAFSYVHHFVYPSQLLYSPWGYGGSVAGPDDDLSLSLGTAQLVAGLSGAALLLTRARAIPIPTGAAMTGVAVLIVASAFTTAITAPLWERLPLLHLLQFPWRFLSLGTVAVCFVCGSLGAVLPSRGSSGTLSAALIVLVFLGLGFPQARPGMPPEAIGEELTPQQVADWQLQGIANGFVPIWANQRPAEPARDPLTVLAGRATWSVGESTSTRRGFTVSADEPSSLRLHSHYFPGWRLAVDDVEEPIAYDNSLGAMDFTLTSGSHRVVFTFADTSIRSWSAAVSVAGAVALVVLALVAHLRQRRPTGPALDPAPAPDPRARP